MIITISYKEREKNDVLLDKENNRNLKKYLLVSVSFKIPVILGHSSHSCVNQSIKCKT